jgi:WD40 repeat protein
LRFWSPECKHIKTVEAGDLRGACPLPDGRILSWSYYKTLSLWSSEGNPISAFEDGGSVEDAMVLPDGRILSRGEDRTYRQWEAGSVALQYQFFAWEGWPKYGPKYTEARDEKARWWKCRREGNAVKLEVESSMPKAVWHSFCPATVEHLSPDGTVLLTLASGDVFLLAAYRGNFRARLEDVE